MKFKSLTLRIWVMISGFICAVVLAFLIVFALVLKDNDEEGSRHLFAFMHSVVLNDVQGITSKGDLLGSIERENITHFLYNRQDGERTYITGHNSRIADSLIPKGMALAAGGDTPVYTQRIDRRSYLVQISRADAQSYLFSYRPLAFNEDMKQIIFAGIVIILLSLPISKLIATRIGKPLRQLEAYTKRIADKDWGSELAIEREDEIGRLADSMKAMKEALRIADEEERKFLQSISHDLKTPVMIISSYAQAMIDGMYEGPSEEPSLIIKAEADRLERKIKQILYLNTLDYMLENDKLSEDVLLDKLLSYLVANFKAVAPRLTWELQLESRPAAMSGNPDRIRVSIENILDNQLRFASKTVQVALREAGPFWIIEIRNDGPLLSEDDRDQLFKSFYKGAKGNFGLGLSISRKIADFYGGTIEARNEGGRVCFAIRYPKQGGGSYLPRLPR
ncbi:sensor histidine kinase [Cohnella fermenti]|uniref:histidine kinase n=1 Tax=Cohnella fermenti TaxID=2565925 RepID=A0A4S4C7S5_9BACL|nr:ATP-binding protein [Cohnella fermenti]THF83694.1 HAMP domain-containing protein [Cohnella fermenti]